MNNRKHTMMAICLLFIISFIGGCATQPESTPIQSSSPTPASTPMPTEAPKQDEASIAAWREDLNVLMTRMEDVHPNLYWRVSEEEVETAVNTLNAQIPNLTDQEIIVEFARIVSLFDGHTHLPLFQPNVDFHLYPIRLYQFSDGLFVVDADEPYTDLSLLLVTRLLRMLLRPFRPSCPVIMK